MAFIRALILHIGKDGTSTWSLKNNRVGILRSVEYVHTASRTGERRQLRNPSTLPSSLLHACMTCGKMDISLYRQIHDGIAFPCRAWNGAHWMALPTASARAYVRAFIARYLNKSVVVYSKCFSFFLFFLGSWFCFVLFICCFWWCLCVYDISVFFWNFLG